MQLLEVSLREIEAIQTLSNLDISHITRLKLILTKKSVMSFHMKFMKGKGSGRYHIL